VCQSNLPLSTTMPPSVVPEPQRNFVAECTLMSAPHSKGRLRNGVAMVESMMSGMPAAWATSARPSMSAISPDGFAIVSAKMSLVLSVMAAA
jgi:hypothetical protein